MKNVKSVHIEMKESNSSEESTEGFSKHAYYENLYVKVL